MTKSCCSTSGDQRLIRPGPIGTVARFLLGLLAFGGSVWSLRAGGAWSILALALAAFGILLWLAALMREPGCEVNLIWTRVLGKSPIGCIFFNPIDRWERGKSK